MYLHPWESVRIDKKEIPWSPQSSSAPFILLPNTWCRANPGAVAAPHKIASCSHIRVLAIGPVRDQYSCQSVVIANCNCLIGGTFPLFYGFETSSNCCVKEGISQSIVAADFLTPWIAAECIAAEHFKAVLLQQPWQLFTNCMNNKEQKQKVHIHFLILIL